MQVLYDMVEVIKIRVSIHVYWTLKENIQFYEYKDRCTAVVCVHVRSERIDHLCTVSMIIFIASGIRVEYFPPFYTTTFVLQHSMNAAFILTSLSHVHLVRYFRVFISLQKCFSIENVFEHCLFKITAATFPRGELIYVLSAEHFARHRWLF